MNNASAVGAQLLKELESESSASRKCLERLDEKLFDWKPHEKSMPLGYLALLVAEIPKWIHDIVAESEIDFATYDHIEAKTPAELIAHHDENMRAAKSVLQGITDETLAETFYLKSRGEVVFSASKLDNISSSINHLVHHRGQLTVYMRLNDLSVPSIYGPSADDRGF